MDCSGLIQMAFASQGIWIPRDAYQQERFCQPVATQVGQLHLLQPGDLVFFGTLRRCNHVGLYLGRGLYRHSSGTEHGRNGIGVDSLHPTNDRPVSSHYRSQLRGLVVWCVAMTGAPWPEGGGSGLSCQDQWIDGHAHPLNLSVVVPLFNEEESLPHLVKQLLTALRPTGESFEIVLVNDGSSDGTAAVLEQLSGEIPELVAVLLRKNYGQTAAMAGFDVAQGEVIVSLDGDLQNDPADIPMLLDKLSEGYDLVSGWRHQRQDAALQRKLPSRLANRLIGRVTGVRLHDYGCSLKAYRREVLADMRLYGELHRFLPALAFIEGPASPK